MGAEYENGWLAKPTPYPPANDMRNNDNGKHLFQPGRNFIFRKLPFFLFLLLLPWTEWTDSSSLGTLLWDYYRTHSCKSQRNLTMRAAVIQSTDERRHKQTAPNLGNRVIMASLRSVNKYNDVLHPIQRWAIALGRSSPGQPNA